MMSVYLAPCVNGDTPAATASVVRMHDQLETELARHAIAELDHLPEFPGRVDVHQRKRQAPRMEGLARQVQQHRAVLADRIQHDRVVELGRHLADDLDALGLEALKLRHVLREFAQNGHTLGTMISVMMPQMILSGRPKRTKSMNR